MLSRSDRGCPSPSSQGPALWLGLPSLARTAALKEQDRRVVQRRASVRVAADDASVHS